MTALSESNPLDVSTKSDLSHSDLFSVRRTRSWIGPISSRARSSSDPISMKLPQSTPNHFKPGHWIKDPECFRVNRSVYVYGGSPKWAQLRSRKFQ